MGRTNPTFRDVLRGVRERWRPFRRGLRREDQARFDDLLEMAGRHADAASYANPADPVTAVLLSVLLEQQATIDAVEDRLVGVEERLDDLEDRLDRVETDARLGGTETEARLAGVEERLHALEVRVGAGERTDGVARTDGGRRERADGRAPDRVAAGRSGGRRDEAPAAVAEAATVEAAIDRFWR